MKEFLSHKEVDYTERDISTDRSAEHELVQLTGFRGVPVIVISGEYVIGFNQARLEELLLELKGSP